jgi:hypothetical protein
MANTPGGRVLSPGVVADWAGFPYLIALRRGRRGSERGEEALLSEQWDRPTAAIVRVGDAVHELAGPGCENEFTFGRADNCTVCLDPDDIGISRLAGSIEADGGTWWVVNRSARRPLAVIDEFGFRSVLPPGRRYAVEGRVRVVVDGTHGSHELDISGPARNASVEVIAPGESTAVGAGVMVSQEDRLALVALFAGYLEEGRRHDPHPKSYNAAAARLRWTDAALRKRIEYLRSRLDKAGVPNMTGWNALSNLAEYVLSTGLITRDDLRLIREP